MGGHRVVRMGQIPRGDFRRRSLPHAIMGEDVAERLVEIARAMGLRDEICVQRNAHHTTAFRAFCIQSVELPLDHFSKVVALIRVVQLLIRFLKVIIFLGVHFCGEKSGLLLVKLFVEHAELLLFLRQ